MLIMSREDEDEYDDGCGSVADGGDGHFDEEDAVGDHDDDNDDDGGGGGGGDDDGGGVGGGVDVIGIA